MGYIADPPDRPGALGCGGSCSCGPCRAAGRLSESYVKPDGDDDEPDDDEQKGFMAGCASRLASPWGQAPRGRRW